MRDLAKQNLGSRSRAKKISPRAIRIIAIVGVIVAVVLFLNSGINLLGVGGGAEGIHDAPHGLTPVSVAGGPVSVEGGINLSTDKAILRNVSDIKASATAERVYGGGSFTMTVNATFAGTQGHKYQVWLTDGDSVADGGYLEGSGNSWSTTFRDSDKGYSKMDGIWITDELTTEDNRPETKMLVGSF